MYLLSDTGQEIIKTNKRSYGDNLDKFEPGDINDSFCPNQNQFAIINNREAQEVIDTAKTDEELAIKMSNQLIEKLLTLNKVLHLIVVATVYFERIKSVCVNRNMGNLSLRGFLRYKLVT